LSNKLSFKGIVNLVFMSESSLREKLREIKDPEIGLSIVDMGLIYEIKIEAKVAKITMTLTTPMCPMGGLIMAQVEEVVKQAGFEPEVDLVFDPPWTPDKLTLDLKKKLNF